MPRTTNESESDEPRVTAPRDTAQRVLLIEDDPGDRLLFEAALADVDPDLQVESVTRMESVPDALSRGIDCIVLDLGLPGRSGLDALWQVHELVPDTAVVVLTGWLNEGTGVEAVAAGAQDYLIKGDATPSTIARSIRFAIERKQNERSAAALVRAELRHLEQVRLERALLGRPLLRRPDIDWTSRFSAARSGVISGDFYDGVELEDGTLRLVIGDVAGHGPDEAALGVSLRAGWRALVLSRQSPHDTLVALEDLLIAERGRSNAFATVCDVSIEPGLGCATVRLAGHPPPVLAGRGQLRDDHLGPPLGVPRRRDWRGTEHPLDAKWSMVLYTDGLFEVRGRSGDVLTVDEVPPAVEGAVVDGRVDAERLLASFAARATEGWRDDVAVAVLSHRAQA